MARWMVNIMVTAALINCLLLAGCGSNGTTTQPGNGVLVHQGTTGILYSDLSSYSIGYPEATLLDTAAATSGQPATMLALGLNAGDQDVQNLEVSAELRVPGDSQSYRLFLSPERKSDVWTVDTIQAGEEAHLTQPVYLDSQVAGRLKSLNDQTVCTLVITVDPSGKQSDSPLSERQRHISVVYLPPSLFDPLPMPGAKTTPPYSGRYFNSEYDQTWGAEPILAAHLDYLARATWEPMAELPSIPYAVGLECGAHVSLNVFGHNKHLLKGDFVANMNSTAIPQSGYRGYLELFGTKYFDDYAYLESASKPIVWNPVVSGSLPKQEEPFKMDINLGGGIVVTVLSEIEGTWQVGFPGSLSLSSKPWLLKQAFTPEIKAKLVSTIKSPSTRYVLVAPMQLLDANMRARLDDLKVDTSVPRVTGKIQWPADLTLLKGALYLTDKNNPKWKWKIYEYAIYDTTYRLAQEGLVYASRSGYQVVQPELIMEPRKW